MGRNENNGEKCGRERKKKKNNKKKKTGKSQIK